MRTPLGSLLLVLAAGLPAQEPVHLVRLHDGAVPGRGALLARMQAAEPGSDEAADAVQALARATRGAAEDLRRVIADRGGEVRAGYWIVPALLATLPPGAVEDLRARPEVASIGPARPSRGHIAAATSAQNHDADAAQARGVRGRGAGIAVLDSGLTLDFQGSGVAHPAFGGDPATGRDRIALSRVLGGGTTADDEDGHGTLVGAIAAGERWSAVSGADHGFAPDATLFNYRITAPGAGTTVPPGTLIAAYQQVLQDKLAGGRPIHVAVCSFAGDPYHASPEQTAADILGQIGDVLLVTSAGNDGTTLLPTLRSQANLNGLAVGAVAGGSHGVAAFSSWGPIAGDRRRTFPDLVAVGVGVVGPARTHHGTAPAVDGTSFAAPMVAGTAALVRSVQPGWTALETKAVLLNGCADLRAANPNATANHYGHGLLRTDHAVDAARLGEARRLTLPDVSGSVLDVPVAVQAGVAYAATVVWHRRVQLPGDVLDDLDLVVLDPAGRSVALGTAPSSVVERVVFRPATGGTFTLRVRGTEVHTIGLPVEVAVAFGPARGGGRQQGSYFARGSGCPGSAPDPAQVVLPAGSGGAFANSRTRVPLAPGAPARFLQAFDHTAFPAPLVVHRLAFRRDDLMPSAPVVLADLEIVVGHTGKAAGALDPTFANNYVAGTARTVRARRPVSFPGVRGAAATGEFDYAIDLDRPFLVDPAAGRDLLLEIRVYGDAVLGSGTPALDARAGVGFGSVQALGSATATSGFLDPHRLVVGFVGAPPGQPVRGSTAPRLTWEGTPQLGRSFALVLRDARPGAPAFLTVSTSVTAWRSRRLPIDLGPLGAPGCLLHTGIDGVVPLVVGPAGQARVELPIPDRPIWTGTWFANQFAVGDPANPLGLVVSNAGFGLVGG